MKTSFCTIGTTTLVWCVLMITSSGYFLFRPSVTRRFIESRLLANSAGDGFDEPPDEFLIAPSIVGDDRQPPSSPSDANGFVRSVDKNWKFGFCKHKVAFEATETIKKIRFQGDLAAFSLVDGHVCVIRISTGDILDRYFMHKGEVRALDFDGQTIVSGGKDGIINIYEPTFKISKKLSTAKHSLKLHTKKIVAVKLVPAAAGNKLTVLSIANDNKLIAIDAKSGEIKFTTTVEARPTSLDCDGSYIGVGVADGRILFYSLRTGDKIMQFQAHTNSSVRSLYMQPGGGARVLSGGDDGIIRRWDLTGSNEPQLLSNKNKAPYKPARFLDFYFKDALLTAVPSPSSSSSSSSSSQQSATTATTTPVPGKLLDTASNSNIVNVFRDGLITAPVVAIQGDDDKILAAYSDGTISSWDVASGKSMFTMKGRTSSVGSLQFDGSRLMADGTYNILVVHDFSELPTDEEQEANDRNQAVGELFDSYDDNVDDDDDDDEEEDEIFEGDGDGNGDDDQDDDDDDGGRPGATG